MSGSRTRLADFVRRTRQLALRAPESATLAKVYYGVVAPATLALVFLIVPMRGYNERAHLYRAEALSNGLVLPAIVQKEDQQSAAGGQVDRTLRGWSMRFAQWNVDIRPLSVHEFWSRLFVHSDDARIDVAYSNTVIYPPFLYVPATAAIGLAKAVHAPVAVWFYAARLANALTAIAIITSLMKTMPALRPVILVFASLPILFFQSATVSNDGVMLPVALAFACLLATVFAGHAQRRATTVALAVATVVLCVGKIAYLPFAILPPIAARAADGRWSRRAVMLAATSIASAILWAGWSWIIHDKIFTMRLGVAIDPFAQLRWVAAHPLAALQATGLTVTTDASAILQDVVGGRVGGMHLWDPMDDLGVLLLLAAAFRGATAIGPRWFAGVAAATAVAICFGVVLLLYLQFNTVASELVVGIQGRYFIPSLAMLIVFSPIAAGKRTAALFDRLAIVFAIVSVLTTLGHATSDFWTA